MKNLLLAVLFLYPLIVSAADNPLLEKWSGPYQGVPPFDKVKVSDFKPALEQAMSEQKKEIEAIANNKAAPTFANTIEVYDHAGQTLKRVLAVFEVWRANMNTPEFQVVGEEMAPKLAAFTDEIMQNVELFKRIDAIYNSKEKKKLTAEQQRLVWMIDTQFVLSGARLNAEQKARVGEINKRLATLQNDFSQHQLSDEEQGALVIDNAADLAGLPQEVIESSAKNAEENKIPGKWRIANTRSSMGPFLTYSTKRELREKAFRIWTSRGDNGNENDNNKIVTEILKLRAERSKILGYQTFAHWHLADSMAKDPDVAMNLMMRVWRPALERVKEEVADMQAIVDQEGGGFKIQPWDYRFYAEKVRKAKYDLDLDVVKPYLQLDNIRKSMFWSAGKLYGFKFEQITGIPVFHKDVSVYKVLNSSGKLVGLWYFDPYARPGKKSGAWMTSYREQSKNGKDAVLPIVSNNSNFIAGVSGEPTTISWDDANTMFHEFGHALHGLNSDVHYQSLSGTNTVRDFVEFPSQFNEHYFTTPEGLKFLVNKEGQPLPKDLLSKIEKAKRFNSGFDTVEFLASGIVDMKLHLAGDKEIDPKAFEASALKELNMPSEIVMRHRIPQFGHLFSDEGYAAGYYGYLWAQVLEHDAFEAFTETGNPYNPKLAKKCHDLLFSVGNTVDPAVAYRKFRGRDPKVDALLRARGFPVQENTKPLKKTGPQT